MLRKYFLISFLMIIMVMLPVSGCGSLSASNSDHNQAMRRVIEIQVETRQKTIAFQNVSQNDATLTTGETVLKQKGVNGASEVKYVDLYLYGKKVFSFPFFVKTISKPVDQVVAEGTAAPEQSYVNSYNQSASSSSSQSQADQAAAYAKAKAESAAQEKADFDKRLEQQSEATQKEMQQMQQQCRELHQC